MTAVAMASDEIYDWWLSFIASFRRANPDTPLVVIPYNDNVSLISELSEVFNYEMLEADFSDIDHFAFQLFGENGYRNRLRKLKAFDLPVDYFLYIDVDTLVYLDLDKFMESFSLSSADVAFCTPSEDTTFNEVGLKNEQLSKCRYFSSGFLAIKRSKASLDGILDCILSNVDLYKSVRHNNVIDQPILNFCASLLNWKVLRVDEVDSTVSPHKWYLDPNIDIQNGLPVDRLGRHLPVLHWAGEGKNGDTDPSIELRRPFILMATVEIERKKPWLGHPSP